MLSRSLSKMLCHTALCALSYGCSGNTDEAGSKMPSNSSEAVQNYAHIVHASYEDSLALASELHAASQAFVADPTPESLGAARNAWLAAREPYLQTEVFRFYDGPIDNTENGPEGSINAWPLDEAYIDYVEGDPSAGIVNDPSKTIGAEALRALNEQGGEENIATGFHAAEFLLWGQDHSADGPGDRPHTDYVVGQGGTVENQDRRSLYLTTVTEMLVGDLQMLVDAWAPDQATNYRAELEAATPEEGLRRILTGMIVLSGFETGGERLQTALDSGDQEDEHSCFSDNTHRDMVQDVQGMKNVWHGSYTRLDGSTVQGTGIVDVVREADATLASDLDARIGESLELANAIVPPFDREIDPANTEGHARLEALVTSLRTQENLLEEVFRSFELSIPVVE